MAKLLDPKREYFIGRVISRDDRTQKEQKDLDVILGQESAVVILDDTENVWMKYKDNLIPMESYDFFALHQFHKSLSRLKSDETELDGTLACVLEALKRIHHMFFDETDGNLDFASRDIRQVMETVRKEVLKGCKIVFEYDYLLNMAEELGATCSMETDPSVTHVASIDDEDETEMSSWAVKEHKLL
ncbi:NLI interacting factor, partial [Corchorus capsularis]